MDTSISMQALNAIFSEGRRVMVEMAGYHSTMFYAENGAIWSICGYLGKIKRDDLDLITLHNHFENMIAEGANIRILGKR